MARFRLRGKHYINVVFPQAEWEHKELDEVTKREKRKRYLVPTYLNPEEPGDCNYPGEIIVSTKEERQYARDYVFSGPPTPDMEPLDEEAEALLKEASKAWAHPIESLSGTYGDTALQAFEAQIVALLAKKGSEAAAPVAASAVSKEDFEALQAQVVALMAQNAELLAQQPRRV